MKTIKSLVSVLLLAISAGAQMWIPKPVTSWQWQLSSPVNTRLKVQMYDIDLFDNSSSVVVVLHNQGAKVVCYVDVGTWENWRPDEAQFPAVVKGKSNGWPGEKWLDVRRWDILGPILSSRFDLCLQKGFDAVEPDNMDGYSNSTGFSLTYQDQLTFNREIAFLAHARGLSVAMKNDVEQVPDLVSFFDFALDEQCFQYNECNALAPFTAAGKAVFEVEYKLSPSRFCAKANALNFNSLKKTLSLNETRTACR